jgi:hypothetical protein
MDCLKSCDKQDKPDKIFKEVAILSISGISEEPITILFFVSDNRDAENTLTRFLKG